MTRNGWAPYAGDLRKRRAGTIAALLAARKAALEAGDAEQASAAGDAIDAIYNAAVGDEAVGLGAAFKAAKVLADSIDAGRMTLATNDADAEVPDALGVAAALPGWQLRPPPEELQQLLGLRRLLPPPPADRCAVQKSLRRLDSRSSHTVSKRFTGLAFETAGFWKLNRIFENFE